MRWWAARLERQLCSFLSHDVMKTWGTFLKSQNLISNEILIIVVTKNHPNPHKLVVNFIKPRCLMGIQSTHEWNWTCGQPHTYLASHSLRFYSSNSVTHHSREKSHLFLSQHCSPVNFTPSSSLLHVHYLLPPCSFGGRYKPTSMFLLPMFSLELT